MELFEFHIIRNSSFLGLSGGIKFLPIKRMVKFHSDYFIVKFLQRIQIPFCKPNSRNLKEFYGIGITNSIVVLVRGMNLVESFEFRKQNNP